MQWISKRNTAMYAAILMMAAWSVPRNSAAQTVQFSTEADAVSGTVTKTVLGLLPTTATIAPVDQSTSADSGANDNSAASASQTILGVEVYNLSNIDDSTAADDIAEDGTADAITGPSSLLGGLITWTSNDDPLACSLDSSNPTQLDCSSTETIQGLTINGVAVAQGTYPAGSSFPVNGTISDPQCLLGTETFSGTLFTQESQITGQGTDTGSVNLTGLHLVGEATCKTLALVPLFTTSYDLKVSGPENFVKLVSWYDNEWSYSSRVVDLIVH